jgi:transcriptional regulator with XRE-family HTH domain
MPKSLFSREYGRFCAALVAERRAAGLTQADLAGRLRKPQSYVSKYENGERRLDVIEFLHIAAAVGFDAGTFIRKLQTQS